MSGFGERFRREGYKLPKPLILVDGKPIIKYVIDMFPGDNDFIFICNRDHLITPEYKMAETLRLYCPEAKIIPIAPHKLGPVNAILEARESIDLDKPTIINYCDFTCYWDFEDFKKFVNEVDCDGSVPAYKGFHPHSLGSTFYAYMKHTSLWMDDIQEKQPWTDTPTNEYSSSGTYYFRTGQLCLNAFDEQIAQGLDVNGEFYVSLAYRVLKQNKKKIAIYELQHFMQWGTPSDLEEYIGWSNTFRRLGMDTGLRARHSGTLLVPMAGLGSRFAREGYKLAKPLIPVSGRAMSIQAIRNLPETPSTIFILRKDIPDVDEVIYQLETSFVGAIPIILNGLTEGQAITCLQGLSDVDMQKPITIGACDNGMLYNTELFSDLMEAEDGPDVLVWTIRGHSDGIARPQQFGWVVADEGGQISDVLVKEIPKDPKTSPLIVGAFTFRKAQDFKDAIETLVSRNGRVNNEFYVDSLIKDAVDVGLDCRIFEIDHYIGWGTPNDLKIFQYWQSCFHKWKNHPYRLQNDCRIPSSQLNKLELLYKKVAPRRPT